MHDLRADRAGLHGAEEIVRHDIMTTEPGSETFCAHCGEPIDEPTGFVFEERKPCQSCGSRNRNYSLKLEGSVSLHGQLRGKAINSQSKKPFSEIIVGSELYKKFGRLVHKYRLIDRRNNRYVEKIVDPVTGKTIHEVEEPLSSHQGHGSDKAKNNKGRVN